MRLWRRDHRVDGPDPDTCEHAWRLRNVSLALPGPYVCEVCDHCGALRLDGPETITGPASTLRTGPPSTWSPSRGEPHRVMWRPPRRPTERARRPAHPQVRRGEWTSRAVGRDNPSTTGCR